MSVIARYWPMKVKHGWIVGASIIDTDDCPTTFTRKGAKQLAESLNTAPPRAVSNPLDDPEAMARATEALQVSADMPHNERARYIIAAAIGGQ